jgi:hypothetical protein
MHPLAPLRSRAPKDSKARGNRRSHPWFDLKCQSTPSPQNSKIRRQNAEEPPPSRRTPKSFTSRFRPRASSPRLRRTSPPRVQGHSVTGLPEPTNLCSGAGNRRAFGSSTPRVPKDLQRSKPRTLELPLITNAKPLDLPFENGQSPGSTLVASQE